MKVAVAGAGFAGLACAERLVALGHDVSVFEARTRVGGRVWSQRLVDDNPDTVVERGAEFVLAGYSRLREVVDRLGLSLVDTGMSYYVREPRGGPATTTAAMAAAGRRIAEAARTAPSSRSLLELSSRLLGDRAAIDACVARISLSCAYPPDLLSCHAALEGIAETEWQPTHRVLGGNQLIANGLADRLGDRLRTGAPVTAITSSTGEVRLRCGGADVHADAVVLAVPASLIGGIRFAPALPQSKLAALDRLGYGQAAKLHIPLTRSSPTSAVLDVGRGYWCWTANGSSGEAAPVLHCFAGGEQALEGLRVGAGPTGWVTAVGELRPDLALSPAQALVTTWRDDPWAGMAYSATTTRQLPGDADALAASCGRVHFAGEHTAGAWASLMEGALRSGLRAADEVHAMGPVSG